MNDEAAALMNNEWRPLKTTFDREILEDFISKLHTALKETAETEYWLRLLLTSEYISEAMGDSMRKDCLELKRILIASINTAKSNTK